MLLVQGQGLEPRLDFTPSVLELGPILPFSPGDDVEVLVRNPCSFPIEFYSLEMDKQYVEEEKVKNNHAAHSGNLSDLLLYHYVCFVQILRMLKGYDAQNTLLLPPRSPGEKLPLKILEYYEEKRRLQEEQERGHGVQVTETGECCIYPASGTICLCKYS